MTYRQSEMYNCAKYLKNLPLQSVSSKGNLQVVDKFRKCVSLYIYIYILISSFEGMALWLSTGFLLRMHDKNLQVV